MKINPAAPTLAQLQQKTASSEPPPPAQTSKTVSPPNNRKRVVRRKKIRKIPRPSSEATTNTDTRPVAQRRVQARPLDGVGESTPFLFIPTINQEIGIPRIRIKDERLLRIATNQQNVRIRNSRRNYGRSFAPEIMFITSPVF